MALLDTAKYVLDNPALLLAAAKQGGKSISQQVAENAEKNTKKGTRLKK